MPLNKSRIAGTDRADLAQGKAAVHNDVKNGDMAAAKKEQRKARQAKNDLSQDKQNTIGISEWRVRFEPTLPEVLMAKM
jgi:hypothetical protein